MTKRVWKALGIVLAIMLVSSIAVVANDNPDDPEPESLLENEGTVRMKFAVDGGDLQEGIYINENRGDQNRGDQFKPSLRVYGNGSEDAAFPYETVGGPFDLKSPEAPPKDFIQWNPAILGEGDGYDVIVDGADAREKVHLRQWYVPKYPEPRGEVWAPEEIQTTADIVKEYTYILLDAKYLNPKAGSAGRTWMYLPVGAESCDGNHQVGLESFDVDFDCQPDLIKVNEIGDGWVDLQTDNIWLEGGRWIQFLDHAVWVASDWNASEGVEVWIAYSQGSNKWDQIPTDSATFQLNEGDTLVAGRKLVDYGENVSPTLVDQPWYLYIESLDAKEGRALVRVGRLVKEGETFFVDGAEYDVAQIHTPDGKFKSITLRNPLPKCLSGDCPAISFNRLTVEKEPVRPWDNLPILPPFNMDHNIVDDIQIPEIGTGPDVQRPDNLADEDETCGPEFPAGFFWGCDSLIHELFNTVRERIVYGQPPVEEYFISETKEPRFDTNLLEEKFSEPDQKWQWINIETMPWNYTEFVLPYIRDVADQKGLCPDVLGDTPLGNFCAGDYILVSSFMTEDSTAFWPDAGSVRVKFVFDNEWGQDVYVNNGELRVYGRGGEDAAFPYETFDGPFNLKSPEAPPKDFIQWNPAFLWDDERADDITVNGHDARQKVHLRQWYVPEYMEPRGEVWTYENQKATKDIVKEYTYILLDPVTLHPITGRANETYFYFPVADTSDQIGLDSFDVNWDGRDDVVKLYEVGEDYIDIGTESMEVWEGGYQLQFLDHTVRFEAIGEKVRVKIFYGGNRGEEGIPQDQSVFDLSAGDMLVAGRHEVTLNQDPTPVTQPWYLKVLNIQGNVLQGYKARVVVGRLLKEGETFFVDGAEYDVAKLFTPGGDLKYITLRNPLPKCVDGQYGINFKNLTIWKECVDQGYDIPFLPPFNMDHTMVDDVDIPVGGTYEPDEQNLDTTDIESRLIDVCPVYEQWTEETKEPRFDTNLLEEKFFEPDQLWQWINIETKPWDYTAFRLPDRPDVQGSDGDYILVSSWMTEDSELAPCDAPVISSLTADPMTVELGEVITFTADAGGTAPLMYHWDFDGDGVVDKTTETGLAKYTYAEPGSFTATLMVENKCGEAEDTVEVEITCEAPVITSVSATPDEVLLEEPITFAAEATGTEPLTYQWDFGDGETATGSEVEYTYSSTGSFIATLTVTGPCGDPVEQTVKVKVVDCDPPVITAFDAPESRFWGQTATFAATVEGDEPFSYAWDFGDAGAGTLVSGGQDTGEYLFAAPGIYMVELEVTGACLDLTDTASAEIEIEQFPGDVNGDCMVNVLDVQAIVARWFTSDTDDDWDPIYDFTGPEGEPDGKVNVLDVQYVVNRMGTSCSD